MSLGTLALIGACGLAGPLISAAGHGAPPVVLGEILAGVLIGRSGLGAIDANDPILIFFGEVGFLMVMFEAGMSVPLHDTRLRDALGKGLTAAAVVAVLALGAAPLVAAIAGAGHTAIYAVLLASGSAAVVLPIFEERGITGPVALATVAQVTAADMGATLAVPIVLRPDSAGEALAGIAVVVLCVVGLAVLSRRLGRVPEVHRLRKLGKHRRWALDLRVALVILFALGWISQRSGAGLLVAGFGAGLMVAVIGGPKRLSTEVLGIGGGFFVPLFFVLLGARLDVQGLFTDPRTLALAGALLALAVLVHVLAALLTRQRPATGLVSVAQLGIPSAIVALGLTERVITAAQGAAILAAALGSVLVCSLGAALLLPSGDTTGIRSGVQGDQ
jgi:Kef-type K+ transport system membrane component KefB